MCVFARILKQRGLDPWYNAMKSVKLQLERILFGTLVAEGSPGKKSAVWNYKTLDCRDAGLAVSRRI